MFSLKVFHNNSRNSDLDWNVTELLTHKVCKIMAKELYFIYSRVKNSLSNTLTLHAVKVATPNPKTPRRKEKKDNNKYRYRIKWSRPSAATPPSWKWPSNQARNRPPTSQASENRKAWPSDWCWCPDSCLESASLWMRNAQLFVSPPSIPRGWKGGWREGKAQNQCNDISGVIGMEFVGVWLVRYWLWIDTMANTIRCWDNPSQPPTFDDYDCDDLCWALHVGKIIILFC